MKKLIIFDVDGVLVDSEVIDAKVRVQYWKDKFGISIPIEKSMQLFLKGSGAERKYLESLGAVFDEDPDEATRQLKREARKYLQPFPGTREMMLSIPVAKCVASGSSLGTMADSLKTAGIDDLIPESARFSCRDLPPGRGKPNPDIFLKAAEEMGGFSPEDCLVVEDSLFGIQAAKAAGMDYVVFLGAAYAKNEGNIEMMTPYLIGGVKVAYSHRELKDLIAGYVFL